MNMLRLRRHVITLAAGLIVLSSAGCANRTKDLELKLGLAGQELQNAGSRARDCAPEQYIAAEQALADARQLAEQGDIGGAEQKADEAAQLARAAADASPPGCNTQVSGPAAAEPEAENVENVARNFDALAAALDTVYFDYNQYVIRDDSKMKLTEVAGILRQMPGTTLDIEGHCDVRGSTEYNLHLGERRARSVMKYLIAQGVDPNQLRTISYGEERPVDFGNSESAHAANRRAELRAP